MRERTVRGVKGGIHVRRFLVTLVACMAGALFVVPAAFAAVGYTLHGGAQAEAGDVKLVSDLSDNPGVTTNDASWIDFSIPSGLTLSDLNTLSTQFNVTDDDCKAGSPRFQLNVDGKNIFVYLGPSPSFTGCTQNTWLSSGNLVGTSDQCRVDTSQLISGTQCTTWAAAVAALGSHAVTGIQLTVDSGFAFVDKEQTVLVRNITINKKTFVRGHGQGQSKSNPARMCAAQRALIGKSAFNELWGKNANDRNAFGKCVSAMTKAQSAGHAATVQSAILNTAQTCKSKGMRGERLGACISAHDGVRATRADPAG
jgi:hypothetical protein